MKIKLDEHIPASVATLLSAGGHEVHTVSGEHLTGATDEQLWNAVQREGAFLLTQDLDFSDLRRFAPGSHAGLMVIRLHEPGRTALHERLKQVTRGNDLAAWRGCFVVVTDRKVRVRRPSP